MSREPCKGNACSRQTVILSDAEITGEVIVTSGDLLLVGKINGNIRCSGRVEVSEGASVSGDVSCDSLELGGTIEGTVKTTVLALREQGMIKGKAETARLRIRGERINVLTLRLTHDKV